jgi:MerR family redox-sensitive transcriptional activator SoxR
MSLSIGEVARRSGLSHDALRYYERAGLVPPPRRAGSGHRRYDESVLDLLGVITALRTVGFSITEVQRVLQVKDVNATVGARIEAMHATFDELEDSLDAKEAALHAARSQLHAWREEMDS